MTQTEGAPGPSIWRRMLGRISRRTWTILGTISLGLGAVAGLWSLLHAPVYASTVLLVAESEPAGALSRLSSQFGLALGASNGIMSPQFYADLVTSRVALASVAADSVVLGGKSQPLGALLLGRNAGTKANENDLLRALRKHISVSVDQSTQVISYTVSTANPDLSRQLAHRILKTVDSLTVGLRRQQAANEEAFASASLADSRRLLRQAEDTLQQFMEQNQAYKTSSHLAFVQQRLQRDVDLRQQEYLTLAQSQQQASLDMSRNTPVLLVVDPGEREPHQEPRHVFRNFLLGVIAGLVLVVGALVARAGPLSEF